jgi:hypothetical protein
MPRVSLEKAAADRAEPCRVQSGSEPGVWHDLRFAPGTGWTCTCRGFSYRQRCRHADKKNAESGYAAGRELEPGDHAG